MKKIVINQSCITSGTRVFVAPNIFKAADTAPVKDGADLEKIKSRLKKEDIGVQYG